MSICDVRHQPRAQRWVQRALAGGRLPHACILQGPEGVGRELFATRLARILHCENPVEVDSSQTEGFEAGLEHIRDACGQCKGCRMSIAGTHPDLHVIDRGLIRQHPSPLVRARKGIDLGIDVIREFVIKTVASKPVAGRAKVFIVRESEKLNRAAQNALLKTLEEPPPTTFIFLVARSPGALLSTTRSRCQMISFGLLPVAFIEERLLADHPSISRQESALCAELACGSLGAAENYYQGQFAELYRRINELLDSAPNESASKIAENFVGMAKELSRGYKEQGDDISDSEAQRRAIKTLLMLASVRFRETLRGLVNAADTVRAAEAATDVIDALVATERQIDLNANAQLCLESLFVRLSRLIPA